MPPRGRILILNERDPLHPRAGGVETHVAEVSRRMAEAGQFGEELGVPLVRKPRVVEGLLVDRVGHQGGGPSVANETRRDLDRGHDRGRPIDLGRDRYHRKRDIEYRRCLFRRLDRPNGRRNSETIRESGESGRIIDHEKAWGILVAAMPSHQRYIAADPGRISHRQRHGAGWPRRGHVRMSTTAARRMSRRYRRDISSSRRLVS